MADGEIHKATCACGRLTVEVTGEPERIPICGCNFCRKRTGAVYGTGAYFNVSQVNAINGDSTVFRRGSDSGRYIEGNFCPTCGTTLYWKAELWPELLAVAVGCFDDYAIRKADIAVYTEHIQDWATFDADIPAHKGPRPQ
jgi:hypothetical protein